MKNIEVVYGYLHILGLENIASGLKTQQFDVSALRFCISDVVNKHNNCGMRLRLLFSLWLSIISLFADRINKLSNTINKMSHFNTHAKENITLCDFCTEAIYDIYDTSYNTADN